MWLYRDADFVFSFQDLVLVQTWVENPGTAVADSSSGEGSPDQIERVAQASTAAVLGDTSTHGHVTVYNWESSNEDMDRQRAGSLSTVSTTSSSQDPYTLDEDDRQIALALSEEYQQVDKEVANRLTKLESMKVCFLRLTGTFFYQKFFLA